MKNERLPKNLDLILIDIDDSFIYHRTVAVANRLFLNNFCGLFGESIKGFFTTKDAVRKMLRTVYKRWKYFDPDFRRVYGLALLSGSAIALYFLDFLREFINAVGGSMSNRPIIEVWSRTMILLRPECREYHLGRDDIKDNIYPAMKRVYDEIRRRNSKAFITAITENISIEGMSNPIMDVLHIDQMEKNTFFCRKGEIVDYRIDVGDRHDKKRIAERIIRQRKAKKVCIIIDDYEDLGLLELKQVKAVICTPKIRRLVDDSKYESVLEVDV
ncbi:MAG: hypothetical protein KKE20_06105 [Nanoarchaeota archaeon]|nr:hypothetical protein [Nanoarchaeota archaeon]